jgi:hypothetical protein
MVDHGSPLLRTQPAGDLLWRPAALEQQDDGSAQVARSQAQSGSTALAPGLVAALGHIGQVPHRGHSIPAELAADRTLVPFQATGDLSLRAPFPNPFKKHQTLVPGQVTIGLHTTLLSP